MFTRSTYNISKGRISLCMAQRSQPWGILKFWLTTLWHSTIVFLLRFAKGYPLHFNFHLFSKEKLRHSNKFSQFKGCSATSVKTNFLGISPPVSVGRRVLWDQLKYIFRCPARISKLRRTLEGVILVSFVILGEFSKICKKSYRKIDKMHNFAYFVYLFKNSVDF